jgi:predicted HD phosphohydrolase
MELRRWDDRAKDPEAAVPGLDAYVEDLRRGAASSAT